MTEEAELREEVRRKPRPLAATSAKQAKSWGLRPTIEPIRVEEKELDWILNPNHRAR